MKTRSTPTSAASASPKAPSVSARPKPTAPQNRQLRSPKPLGRFGAALSQARSAAVRGESPHSMADAAEELEPGLGLQRRPRDPGDAGGQEGWTEARELSSEGSPLEYAFSFDEVPGGMASKAAAPALVGRALNPEQLARAVEQGLLMRVRVGRVGRDGKMVSLRVKGRHGPLDISIVREDGTLTLRMGEEDPVLSERIERALRDFSSRSGIAFEVE